MCYKHDGQSQAVSQGKACLFPRYIMITFKTSIIISYFLSLSSYFQRQADREHCIRCQDKVAPGEVKSALGVCTVFVLRKTYEWMTMNKE